MSIESLSNVFESFQNHFDVHRKSTELVLRNILRSEHPDFHVTAVETSRIDLLGYANAGHAIALADSDESLTYLSRIFSPPATRLDPNPGKLVSSYKFCRYQYSWESHNFLLYTAQYTDDHCRTVPVYHILAPRSEDTSEMGTESLTDKLLLAIGTWTNELHKEIYVFDNGMWSKNRELWLSVDGSSWNDVILDPAMKENLIKDVQGFFDNRDLYKQLSVPWKRGLIFHGVPGNGKTISLKALINSLYARADPIPSLYVKNFDARQGEKFSIQAIFARARKMAPCLLIFEDLDSLVTDKTRSYFLNEVDGLESNDGILMVGSTNHLNTLDPAISKRPSRFDRKYHFKLPGEVERIAYCEFWRAKLLNSKMVDFDPALCQILAKMTDGFSFAYLKELFVIVLLTIARGSTGDEVDQNPTESSQTSEQSDDEKSTDGPVVVVKHSDTFIDGSESEANITVKTIAGSQKKTIPNVDVPDHLSRSVLFKVMKKQIRSLLDEMDNSTDSTSHKISGGSLQAENKYGRPPILGTRMAVFAGTTEN